MTLLKDEMIRVIGEMKSQLFQNLNNRVDICAVARGRLLSHVVFSDINFNYH